MFSIHKSFLTNFLLLLACSYVQSKQDSQLTKNPDEFVSPRLKDIAPGCVVLVAKKGTVIYKKAFGIANLESGLPMKPGMIFRIGSVTKLPGYCREKFLCKTVFKVYQRFAA